MGQIFQILSRHGLSQREADKASDNRCKIHGTVLMRKSQPGDSCWAHFHDSIVKGKLDRCQEILTSDVCNDNTCLGALTPRQRLLHLDTVAFSKLRTTSLHMAALYRRQEFVKLLLDQGADPTVMDGFGRTAGAVLLEHWPRVHFPHRVDSRYSDGAILQQASRDYNSDTLLQLQAGCDGEIDVIDPLEDHSHGSLREMEMFRQKVVMWRNRSTLCLKHLIEHGLDLNEIADRRRASTLMHIAARHDLTDVIDLLIRAGGGVAGRGPDKTISQDDAGNVRDTGNERSNAHESTAMSSNQTEIQGPSTHHGHLDDFQPALPRRFREAFTRSVRSVMRRGSYDCNTHWMRSQWSANRGNDQDPEETSSDDLADTEAASRARVQLTAPRRIRDFGPESSEVQALTRIEPDIDSRAVSVDLEVRNGTAKTPLAVAIDRGSLGAARALLAHGADVFCVDFYGRSLLHFLCEREVTFDSLMREVVALGVDVNCVDNGGNTPLHIAAYMGSVSKVQFLLSRGASPDCMNLSGKTPLFLAFHRKDPSTKEVILLFLLSSMDVSLQDKFGRLPLVLQRAENLACQAALDDIAKQNCSLLRRCIVCMRRLLGFGNLNDSEILQALPCPQSIQRAIHGEEERKIVRSLTL